ncbi:MAG: radical SAM protein [bacterium]|nr:radical SAM protein [bacterium]
MKKTLNDNFGATHFMIIPSLSCPAHCSYCFGPREGAAMSEADMDRTLEFIRGITRENGQSRLKVTFHGGEPLAAGYAVLRRALEGISKEYGAGNTAFYVQSNLWLLDPQFCELFKEFNVKIGTSLDGPRHITDAQRGKGYFDRTMKGVRLAQKHGLTIGCIATFTQTSLLHWKEVVGFFNAEGLGMSLHAAVPGISSSPGHGAGNVPLPHGDINNTVMQQDGSESRGGGNNLLTPEQYGTLLENLLDYYILHRKEIAVSSLDYLCKSVFLGEGQLCTFRDCLGEFLVIDPHGDIYSCQRLAGQKNHSLGNISANPSLAQLMQAAPARKLRERQEQVKDACGSCDHFSYCKGGCAYNSPATQGKSGLLESADDIVVDSVRDPFCAAYARVFDKVAKRLQEEMSSDENIEAITWAGPNGNGHLLMRKGPLTELVSGAVHPGVKARSARRIAAAVELAKGPDIQSAAQRLVESGICRNRQSGEASLLNLERSIRQSITWTGGAGNTLNNLYIHVTFNCQLECSHCYAGAGNGNMEEMTVENVLRLIHEAEAAGFRQVIITGGEPLMHGRRRQLLEALAKARQTVAPMNIVLRTNLALPLGKEEMNRIAASAHQVVVSVDGGKKDHDARRGKGNYALVVNNIKNYMALNVPSEPRAQLSLAAVMSAEEARGQRGQAVRELAAELGIDRIRFKPLLPVGRAIDEKLPVQTESPAAFAEAEDIFASAFQPLGSCGLGQNLYVDSTGHAFPCYAYRENHAHLGNVFQAGLQAVLVHESFRKLSCHTVDTNPKCRRCDVRYICGGACRAWGGEATRSQLDAEPPDCLNLQTNAESLVKAAYHYLELKQPSLEHCPEGANKNFDQTFIKVCPPGGIFPPRVAGPPEAREKAHV